MGCFWGAEKCMSELPGVTDVESGYVNGEVDGTDEAVLAQERFRFCHGGAAVEMLQRVAVRIGAAEIERGLDAAIDAAAGGVELFEMAHPLAAFADRRRPGPASATVPTRRSVQSKSAM
jgi:hypothetical protein